MRKAMKKTTILNVTFQMDMAHFDCSIGNVVKASGQHVLQYINSSEDIDLIKESLRFYKYQITNSNDRDYLDKQRQLSYIDSAL